MSLSSHQMHGLLSQAKAHWQLAAESESAYRTKLNKALSLGSWLKYMTIGAAIVTAICTSLPKDGAFLATWSPRLALSAALATTLLAILKEAFTPTQSALDVHKSLQKLEVAREKLVSFTIGLERNRKLTSMQESLHALLLGVQAGIDTPIIISQADKAAAKAAFEESTIEVLLQRYANIANENIAPAGVANHNAPSAAPDFFDEEEDDPNESPQGMAEDAPDIIDVARSDRRVL